MEGWRIKLAVDNDPPLSPSSTNYVSGRSALEHVLAPIHLRYSVLNGK